MTTLAVNARVDACADETPSRLAATATANSAFGAREPRDFIAILIVWWPVVLEKIRR